MLCDYCFGMVFEEYLHCNKKQIGGSGTENIQDHDFLKAYEHEVVDKISTIVNSVRSKSNSNRNEMGISEI